MVATRLENLINWNLTLNDCILRQVSDSTL